MLTEAKIGDKTLMGRAIPAVETYKSQLVENSFADCLEEMLKDAEVGLESTKQMSAKVGRASRIGNRYWSSGRWSDLMLFDIKSISRWNQRATIKEKKRRRKGGDFVQRFVNDPDYVVEDMLKGIVLANPEVELAKANDHVVIKKEKRNGKVGVITGGGSGHEPAFLGYMGEGLLDAVAIGEVFASPPAQAFYDAMLEADTGAGVACLFGNYAGDFNMNVKMAIQMAEDDDIEVKYVVATDDVASSPKENEGKTSWYRRWLLHVEGRGCKSSSWCKFR